MEFSKYIQLTSVLCLLTLFGCEPDVIAGGEKVTEIKPRSYIRVGQLIDTTKGPYVIDVREGDKHLVFIGCEHQEDITHPQFHEIERCYKELKPQVAFNEGGQIPEQKKYASLNEAIRKDGETGVNKYCADR